MCRRRENVYHTQIPVAEGDRDTPPESEGSHRMREDFRRQWHAESRALGVAVVWMLLLQLGCVLLWNGGWLTRQTALVHWLVVGVWPPAMALWRMRPAS